jgi:hypothetical protein
MRDTGSWSRIRDLARGKRLSLIGICRLFQKIFDEEADWKPTATPKPSYGVRNVDFNPGLLLGDGVDDDVWVAQRVRANQCCLVCGEKATEAWEYRESDSQVWSWATCDGCWYISPWQVLKNENREDGVLQHKKDPGYLSFYQKARLRAVKKSEKKVISTDKRSRYNRILDDDEDIG